MSSKIIRPLAGLLLALLFGLTVAACGDATPTSAPTTTTVAATTRAATTASATTAASSTTTVASNVTTAAAATTAAAPATTAASSAATTAAVAVTGPVEKLKVVHVPGLFFAPMYAALERGYFKEQNIEITLDRANSGSEVMAFLAQGQIDVGAVGLSAATFNALNKGFEFRVVASAGIAPAKDNPTLLLVRKALQDDGSVKKVSDLKGKKVAVAGGAGTAGAYLAATALQTDGLSLKDVTVVNLPNPDMVAALKNGAIDAALIGTPFSTQALSDGTAVTLVKDWIPGYSTTTYMYSGKFIKERPEVGKRFMTALIKGARAVQGSEYLSDENVKAYVKYTGSTDKVIRETPPQLYDLNGLITKENIKEQERIHRDSGATEYKQAIDVDKMFDGTFAEAAIKTLGGAK